MNGATDLTLNVTPRILFPGSNSVVKARNTIFKPSFSPDKVNVGGTNEWGLKDLVADVLEYTSRHYGLYVHPVVQSIDDEERKNAKKNAKKKANGSQK